MYRRNQLEKLKEKVVDLEDISGGISITDLNFSDFRVDLTGYLKENKKLLENSPTGLYSIVEIPDDMQGEVEPGVIFLLEQVSGEINTLENNPLHPYYLVYVNEHNETKITYGKAKQLLDYYRKLSHKNNQLNKGLINKFNEETYDGKFMDKYSSMLKTAVEDLVGQKEEKGIESLFKRGGTSISGLGSDSLGDFELISFLIIEE